MESNVISRVLLEPLKLIDKGTLLVEYVLYDLQEQFPGIHLLRFEIINESYISVCHKNWPKHNQHFVTSNQIPTYKKLNFPLISSIYFVFLHLEILKGLQQTKVYHALSYILPEKKRPTNLSK